MDSLEKELESARAEVERLKRELEWAREEAAKVVPLMEKRDAALALLKKTRRVVDGLRSCSLPRDVSGESMVREAVEHIAEIDALLSPKGGRSDGE